MGDAIKAGICDAPPDRNIPQAAPPRDGAAGDVGGAAMGRPANAAGGPAPEKAAPAMAGVAPEKAARAMAGVAPETAAQSATGVASETAAPAMAQESPATLAQALRRIFAGRREWRRLAKANGVTGDTLVVIMPHEGSELNRIALGLLDRLARQKRPDKTLILTPSREALGGGQPLPCGAEARVVEAPAEALWRIMDFYCLYRFHRYLYVVSLTAPRGAAGGELVGVNGITEEELVRLAVLRLRS